MDGPLNELVSRTATEAASESQVSRAMVVNESEIRSLEEAIAALHERLVGVITEDSEEADPRVSEAAALAKDILVEVPLAREINIRNRQIVALRQRVWKLIERIEV